MVTRCVRSLDSKQYDAVAANFAEIGVWERAGERLVGPRAVRDALEKRPADLQTQHLISNLIVDAETESLAKVKYSLSVYAQRGSEQFELHALFKAEDHVIKNAAGWQFLLRTAGLAFTPRA